MIVTDGYGNNRVILFDKTGKFIKQVGKGAGGPTDKGTGPGEWNLPHKLAVDANENLYIIDREGHRVEVFDKNLNYLREIKNDWNPWDINISRKGTDGIGWIADHKDERVLRFNLEDGKITAVWGKQGWGPSEFDWVHGIVVDSKGAVYAADTYGQRIQKFVRSREQQRRAALIRTPRTQRYKQCDRISLVSLVFIRASRSQPDRDRTSSSGSDCDAAIDPLTQQRRMELAGQIDRPAPRVALHFFDRSGGRRRGERSADTDRSPGRRTSAACARRAARGRAGG